MADKLSKESVNELKSVSIGAFSPSLIEISSQGYYNDYVSTGNVPVTFATSGHVEGITEILKATFNGSHTLTLSKPSGITLLISSPDGWNNGEALPSGIYKIYFTFEAQEILVVISEKLTEVI